jgi:hypothetical protein
MISGTLNFVLPPLNNLTFLALSPGDMFGHTDLAHLLNDSHKRDYEFPRHFQRMDTVMSSVETTIMVLSLEDVLSLRLMYP